MPLCSNGLNLCNMLEHASCICTFMLYITSSAFACLSIPASRVLVTPRLAPIVSMYLRSFKLDECIVPINVLKVSTNVASTCAPCRFTQADHISNPSDMARPFAVYFACVLSSSRENLPKLRARSLATSIYCFVVLACRSALVCLSTAGAIFCIVNVTFPSSFGNAFIAISASCL